MLDTANKLELSDKDIELIEGALQTQKKILSVQSQAGGTGAVHKLADVQRVMKRIGRMRASQTAPRNSAFQMLWDYFCTMRGCSHERS